MTFTSVSVPPRHDAHVSFIRHRRCTSAMCLSVRVLHRRLHFFTAGVAQQNTLTQRCPQRQVAKPKHIHAKPGRHKQYSRIQIKSVAGPALHSFLTGQQTVTTTTYDTNKRGQGRRKHHDTASLRNSSK